MSISNDEVLHLARLARLQLTVEEVEGLRGDLEAILAYADRLEDVSRAREEGEEPPSTLRADEVKRGLAPGEATRSAPSASGGLFRVPPVLGGEEG